MDLCIYGCKQEAKFTLKNGNLCCSKSWNSCPSNRKRNSDGLKNSGRNYSEWYKNVSEESKKNMAWNKGQCNPNFSYGGKGNYKKILIDERGHKCESCLNSEWLRKPITLELEHIDGDNKNNVRENLRLLCPNCHSQTPTWRRRKCIGKTARTENEMIEAIKTCKNVNQVLKKLGLKWGSNTTIERCRIRNKLEYNE